LVQPDLEDLVASTGKLAALPSTVVELLFLLDDPTGCAEEVKKIIERDPAMTANVLKLANSAFYGVRRDITSVRDALILLGNRCVTALSFATGIAPVLRRELTGYNLTREEFWNHCLISGAGASEAVRQAGEPQLCSEAFTAGLVHDIGMLVIDPWLHQNDIVLESEGPRFGVCRLEQAELGFDHCQAGARLAENWGFPQSLIEPIARHHMQHFDMLDCDLTKGVAAGNVLAEALESELVNGDNKEYFEDADVGECLTQLGYSHDLLEKVRLDLTTDLEKTLVRATSSSPVEI